MENNRVCLLGPLQTHKDTSVRRRTLGLLYNCPSDIQAPEPETRMQLENFVDARPESPSMNDLVGTESVRVIIVCGYR